MAYNMVSADLIHAIENEYREIKFTDEDVANHMDWAHDAEKWAEAQIAFGSASDFIKDVIAKRARWHSLSKGQYRALMNCVRAEILAADRQAEQIITQIETGKEPLDLSKLPSGHYALMVDDRPIFYRIDNYVFDTPQSFANHPSLFKWKNWIFASLQISDDKQKLGSQRPGQKYQGRHEENLRKILDDPFAAAQLYGRTIGRCGICGRTLTDPDSIELGIGPICAEKLGVVGSLEMKRLETLLKKSLRQ